MSISEVYHIANTARAKLSSEAARPDQNLRLLVGHANLLESLMLELSSVSRDQENWFTQLLGVAMKPEERHIPWADDVIEGHPEKYPEEHPEEDGLAR